MQSTGQKNPEDGDREDVVTGAKVIPLFQKVSQLRHTSIKMGLGEKP